MHLILVSIEASLHYLKPAAIFVCTETGDTARRLAAFRLPVWTVALGPKEKSLQGLLFSAGVAPVHQDGPPSSWNDFVREFVQRHQLPGGFAIVTQRSSVSGPASNHRLEIIDL